MNFFKQKTLRALPGFHREDLNSLRFTTPTPFRFNYVFHPYTYYNSIYYVQLCSSKYEKFRRF